MIYAFEMPIRYFTFDFLDTHHNLVGNIRGSVLVKRRDFKNVIDNASLDPLGKILGEIVDRSGHGRDECGKIY